MSKSNNQIKIWQGQGPPHADLGRQETAEADIGPRVLKAFAKFPVQQKLDERIMACIIGAS